MITVTTFSKLQHFQFTSQPDAIIPSFKDFLASKTSNPETLGDVQLSKFSSAYIDMLDLSYPHLKHSNKYCMVYSTPGNILFESIRFRLQQINCNWHLSLMLRDRDGECFELLNEHAITCTHDKFMTYNIDLASCLHENFKFLTLEDEQELVLEIRGAVFPVDSLLVSGMDVQYQQLAPPDTFENIRRH